MRGWIGFDFDGTIAHYEHWTAPDELGNPIPAAIDLLRNVLSQRQARNFDVKIFTARAFPIGITPEYLGWSGHYYQERLTDAMLAVAAIQKWCGEHVSEILEATCIKDYGMIELIDDRAVQIEMNTGRLIGHSTRGLF